MKNDSIIVRDYIWAEQMAQHHGYTIFLSDDRFKVQKGISENFFISTEALASFFLGLNAAERDSE